MGSLLAAIKKRPLTRDEYLQEIRSNISISSNEGLEQRISIYDEYERYKYWKHNHNTFDFHDVVLKLIDENKEDDSKQLFDAVYLDEVQDFSYDAIYLI